MMVIISKIIFTLSLLGVLFIISRKFPALSWLPEEPLTKRLSFKMIFAWFKDSRRKFVSSSFFQDIIDGLEKSLRKFKILALKIDNISDKFIRKIRRNSSK